MPAQQSTVLFQVAARGLSRRRLQAFARRLEREVASGRAFSCMIASDDELRRLNREFRGKDYPTDVLSFPAEQVPGFQTGSLGEIAVSYDRAKEQAMEYGHGVDQEIEILMLHGLLHLLGMDHETDGGRMSSAERKWRIRLRLPTGLIERVGA